MFTDQHLMHVLTAIIFTNWLQRELDTAQCASQPPSA